MVKDKPKKIYRSREDKLIAGVCGGFAEYFGIDATWIRLICVFLLLAEGVGIFIYIVAWIIIPENTGQKKTTETFAENAISGINKKTKNKKSSRKSKITKKEIKMSSSKTLNSKSNEKTGHLILGILLVIVGFYFIAKRFFYWLDFNLIWPILIVAYGLYILIKKND